MTWCEVDYGPPQPNWTGVTGPTMRWWSYKHIHSWRPSRYINFVFSRNICLYRGNWEVRGNRDLSSHDHWLWPCDESFHTSLILNRDEIWHDLLWCTVHSQCIGSLTFQIAVVTCARTRFWVRVCLGIPSIINFILTNSAVSRLLQLEKQKPCPKL